MSGSYWKLFQWKAYGGAFNDIPAGFNAFPHRRGTLMHAEFGYVLWLPQASSSG